MQTTLPRKGVPTAADLHAQGTPAANWHHHAIREINRQRTLLLQSAQHLRDPVNYVLASEGKRLRPLLLLCFANLEEASMSPADEEFRAAAAVELLHEASLVHDDILDCSTIRRDKASTGEQFSVRTATHAGGFITSLCLATLAECDAHIGDTLGQSLKELVCAQLMEELPTPASIQAHQQRSVNIMQGKTGTLFEIAIRVGVHLQRKKTAHTLSDETARHFSRYFSQAFQMRDDLADLENDASIRKPGGNDLVQGNPTWPFLLWAQQTGDYPFAWRCLMQAKGNPDAAHELQDTIIASGIAQRVRDKIRDDLQQASVLLRCERPTQARDFIQDLINRLQP